jgi:hypothetical protein
MLLSVADGETAKTNPLRASRAVVRGSARDLERYTEVQNKPTRRCYFDETKPNDPWKCGTFRARWLSTTGSEAPPTLIRPSRFPRRSHRENRASYLLSPAREGTRSGEREVEKQTHCERREQWSRGKSARDLEHQNEANPASSVTIENAKTKKQTHYSIL